ncbi:type II secretion system protein GspE [candidate division KSB3 bacterium]|uniref:Type II secretion system protein GspE n=1 Tax=candidate division KSB3 bacterium TaxID=2044937 RepID=A0A2G6KBF6_9BACT|nr:MAG: type II secretion system protein GspE [candidate division KSB3 bacterium]
MARKKRLGELLVEACFISQEQLEEALVLQQQKNQLIGQILVEMGWVSETEVCRAMSELLHVDYIDVESALVSQEVVQLAPKPFAVKRNILPLFVQDRTLYLAMENPLDIDAIQRLEFGTGMQVKPLIAPPIQLRETVRKHYDVDEYVGSMLNNVVQSPVDIRQKAESKTVAVNIGEESRSTEGSQVVKLVNLIITDGIRRRASDIHIEPTAKHVNVRYRVDGLLAKGIHIPKWLQLPLISRMKVIASLDIAEHRKPQDGRIRVSFSQRKIDLRVSMLPTNFGEKIVIRILDKNASNHDLNALGMSPKNIALYRAMLRHPQGWILVTGPTGSGKTTTLYASLNAVKDATKNIITVEDPIEYQLEGINQVQINTKAGMTFASGLRAILRQDPNIILVGEIRDAETAEIAMQASETGHLVLSTLHTNDLIVLAQRLVRKICPHCKTRYTPTPEALQGIGLHHTEPSLFECYIGSGCSKCDHTGYHGQIGLYELLVQNDTLRDTIARRPTKQTLKRIARSAGLQTMLEDGLEKIRQGITTIEEVVRVCPVEQVKPNDHQNTLSQITCQKCQAVLAQEWKFCPFCGVSLSDSAQTTSPKPQSLESEVLEQSELEQKSIQILTADDESSVLEMLETLLQQKGYQVIQAENGEESLQKIRTELPDLVLLDINMPKGDGFSVCKEIRSNVDTMFIPVIMLTGQDSVEEKKKGLACGADEYITKPFDAQNLLSQIEAILRRSARQHMNET